MTAEPSRKHILFLARWYPDRHDSMLGLFVQKHAQAVQIFHDVSVVYVTTDNSLQPGQILKDEQLFDGIREYRIYFGKYNSDWKNAWAYFKHYMQGIAWAEKNAGPVSLSHVHILTRAALPALWLKIKRGTPYLITEHWSRYLFENVKKGTYSGWLRKSITKLLVAHAECVTTVTSNLAHSMKALGLENRYFITPNVADTNVFRLSDKNSNGIKKLVHVSCFDEPAKNIKGIINVIQRLSGNRNDFTIDIIGDGRDFNEVKTYAVQTGLVDRFIFFKGLLTGESLYQSMRDADALVMFSNYENLPCTIVESMCCGVPVVSSRVGGIAEFAGDDEGILVQPGDEEALQTAILQILNNRFVANKELIRNKAVELFSLQNSGKLFQSIYLACLSGKIREFEPDPLFSIKNPD